MKTVLWTTGNRKQQRVTTTTTRATIIATLCYNFLSLSLSLSLSVSLFLSLSLSVLFLYLYLSLSLSVYISVPCHFLSTNYECLVKNKAECFLRLLSHLSRHGRCVRSPTVYLFPYSFSSFLCCLVIAMPKKPFIRFDKTSNKLLPF